VHLWRARLDVGVSVGRRLRGKLTADELERADRFRFEIHRTRYVVSRAVLRELLSRYLHVPVQEIRIVANAHGKPELLDRDLNLQFNLTHAGSLAVYVFATGRRVGVDVEEMSRDVGFRELAARFFSLEERAAFDAVREEDVRRTFYECWTRKEAYIKALGLGVTHGLDNFSVAIGPGVKPALVHSQVDEEAPKKWEILSFDPAEGFVGALAVEGHGWGVQAFDAPEH
jgi:4'-phosphopantetheinyl transferase